MNNNSDLTIKVLTATLEAYVTTPVDASHN